VFLREQRKKSKRSFDKFRMGGMGSFVTDASSQKAALRRKLRQARRDHVAALPAAVSALVFKAPPRPVLSLIPPDAVIGLYCEADSEAPTRAYAEAFAQSGHKLALPHLKSKTAAMTFREHSDPFVRSDLEHGPFGLLQPPGDAPICVPQVLFVPLLGFTADGLRLGQGGGFYDRWLARHRDTTAIGLAWDVQLTGQLPVEEHDVPLTAIITPTRIYGPF